VSEKNKSTESGNSNSQKESTIEIARINRTTTIIVALFTLISACVTAFFASPFLLEIYKDTFEDTPTPTLPVETFLPFPIPTDATPYIEISKTDIPTVTAEITQEISVTSTPSAMMIPQLRFSASEGKAPLSVNFNAEGSFVDVKGGADLLCNFENVCQYTWSVRLGSTMMYEPTLGGSKFSYTFQKKGEYVVVLTVCRGEACESTAVVITVR
jgi:hypothetical protein